jgi:pimeloyl-ACP methyl ester carboxylesterase
MTQPIHTTNASRQSSAVRMAAFLLMTLVMTVASAQQKPTTGYAPVNGLKMYYEVHGRGEPVVLLHGAFMTITNNWDGWISELSETRKVIAVEMQGHGRTADIPRDFTPENLADDVAALLNYLKIPRADLIGYSMGGEVALQCAIRHPDKVRRAVIISSTFRSDGMVDGALESIPNLTAEAFKGSPIEIEYKKLSPTPDDFPRFVKRIVVRVSYDSWRFYNDASASVRANLSNAENGEYVRNGSAARFAFHTDSVNTLR